MLKFRYYARRASKVTHIAIEDRDFLLCGRPTGKLVPYLNTFTDRDGHIFDGVCKQCAREYQNVLAGKYTTAS